MEKKPEEQKVTSMEQHSDVTITSTPREGNPVTINDKVISRLTGVAEKGSQTGNLNENEVTKEYGLSLETHESQKQGYSWLCYFNV